MRTATFRAERPLLRVGATRGASQQAQPCRRKFLRFFPRGFRDETYIAWERGYKEKAHREWEELLGRTEFSRLLKRRAFEEIAARAVRIESRTNLLFSFEKMALRDAVRTRAGAKRFAEGLRDLLHGRGGMEHRFEKWCEAIEQLPRRQTRVLTWPLVTVFGFIAQPETHFFLKPNVTRKAAQLCGYDFQYASRPSWEVYKNLLKVAEQVRQSLRDLQPRDMIDIQSFLWVQGSDEYD